MVLLADCTRCGTFNLRRRTTIGRVVRHLVTHVGRVSVGKLCEIAGGEDDVDGGSTTSGAVEGI